MSAVKRDAEAFEERVEEIRKLIAMQAATIGSDDPYDRHVYAIAFNGWRDGHVTGTAEDIFEAAKRAVDEPHA